MWGRKLDLWECDVKLEHSKGYKLNDIWKIQKNIFIFKERWKRYLYISAWTESRRSFSCEFLTMGLLHINSEFEFLLSVLSGNYQTDKLTLKTYASPVMLPSRSKNKISLKGYTFVLGLARFSCWREITS